MTLVGTVGFSMGTRNDGTASGIAEAAAQRSARLLADAGASPSGADNETRVDARGLVRVA